MSIVLAVFRSIGLFGGVFLLPLFLENVVGYTTIQTGVWMIAGAVSVGLTMPIAGRLSDRYSPAILVTAGCVMVGVSLVMYGNLEPLSSWRMIIGPQVIRGVGLALMMSPLLAAALNAVPRHEIPMASGFLNVAQLPTASPADWRFAQRLGQVVLYRTPGIQQTVQVKAAAAAAMQTAQRAEVLGFQNGFAFAGIILLCAVPLCLLLKPTMHGVAAPRPVAME